eukprot:5100805-Prymnesium_polylepis.1
MDGGAIAGAILGPMFGLLGLGGFMYYRKDIKFFNVDAGGGGGGGSSTNAGHPAVTTESV